jgi:cold shock CspA family protein
MTNNTWNLGQIKFFDHDKGFGFINNLSDKQDYFVHISKIKTLPINDGDRVVFKLAASKKKQGTFEAISVTHLSQFSSDNDFLIFQFLEIKDFYFRKSILKVLPIHCVEYLLESELTNPNKVSDDVEYKCFIDKVYLILKLFEDIFSKEDLDKFISIYSLQITSDNFKVQLWLDNILILEPSISLIKNFFQSQKNDVREKIYKKLNNLSKISLFESYINRDNLSSSFNNLIIFLHIERDIDIQKKFIFFLTELFEFKKLNLEESNKSYGLILKLLQHLDKEIKEILLSFFYTVTADYIKLKMWLSDLISNEDYDIYHTNFIFLETLDQQKFIKKLFYLLSQNSPNVTYDRISSLKNLTYTYPEGKQFQLDFSSNVILNAIDSIKSGNFLNEESIFFLLTKHIENDTESLLSLNGFFEKCYGRSIPDKTEENEDGFKSILSLKLIPIPLNVEFCEGVRFKEDGKDRTYKHDCWWCRGGSCYKANQIIKLPNSYNEFSLGTFLSILDIPFNHREYFNFLGLLNKINVFLKHLNCRSCNHILKPNKDGYFSYYRVSNFICSNPKCSNKANIYLNHCLGAKKTVIKSKCDNLIDSRDTLRCNYAKHNPKDDFEKFGPYICNHCGSCCSQKSFEKKYEELKERKWNVPPSFEWKVKNKVGHLEHGEVFCYKCGIEMINNEKDYNEFVSNLENPDHTFKVLKKGINVYGFWYMVKSVEIFFEKANEIGLKVSDTNGIDPTIKFISQGNPNFLICRACNSKYNKVKIEFVVNRESETKGQK